MVRSVKQARVIIFTQNAEENAMNISGLFQGIAALAWIGLIGVIIAISVRSGRRQPTGGLTSLVVVLLVLAVLMTTVGAGVVFIPPDQRGVVITIGKGGILPNALEPGIH